jgi:predicted O-linked N-acetylglucosamine transferase (SPINDLY family)
MEVMKARYAAVDIALDTYPYSGGSTTLNALWQGVPVISLQGLGWRSNTASSMLASAGLESLITHSEEEYLQKTVDLANNIPLLKEIREQIKNNIKECPYFRPDIVYPQLAKALQEIRVG